MLVAVSGGTCSSFKREVYTDRLTLYLNCEGKRGSVGFLTSFINAL